MFPLRNNNMNATPFYTVDESKKNVERYKLATGSHFCVGANLQTNDAPPLLYWENFTLSLSITAKEYFNTFILILSRRKFPLEINISLLNTNIPTPKNNIFRTH